MKVKIEKLSEKEIIERGIKSWPIWTKEVSEFDWYYDTQEQCLFLEGKVIVNTDEGNYLIEKGDYVTFSQGLECVWNILEPVKKHYKFS